MGSRSLHRGSHERAFFVYDHKQHGEEADPKDAILFFYPPSVDVEEQIALVGGIIGTLDFCTEVLGSSPSVISLTTCRFALLTAGPFVLGLSSELNVPEQYASQHLQFLWQTFCLFQGSLVAVKQRTGVDGFTLELNRIWNSYFSLCQSFSDQLSMAFGVVPYRELSLSQSNVFLEASHILQTAQHERGVIGGVLLNQNRVLCTQLSTDVTRRLLVLMPSERNFPCMEIKPAFDLPGGVRLLCAFLTPAELASLGPRKRGKSQHPPSSSATSSTADSKTSPGGTSPFTTPDAKPSPGTTSPFTTPVAKPSPGTTSPFTTPDAKPVAASGITGLSSPSQSQQQQQQSLSAKTSHGSSFELNAKLAPTLTAVIESVEIWEGEEEEVFEDTDLSLPVFPESASTVRSTAGVSVGVTGELVKEGQSRGQSEQGGRDGGSAVVNSAAGDGVDAGNCAEAKINKEAKLSADTKISADAKQNEDSKISVDANRELTERSTSTQDQQLTTSQEQQLTSSQDQQLISPQDQPLTSQDQQFTSSKSQDHSFTSSLDQDGDVVNRNSGGSSSAEDGDIKVKRTNPSASDDQGAATQGFTRDSEIPSRNKPGNVSQESSVWSPESSDEACGNVGRTEAADNVPESVENTKEGLTCRQSENKDASGSSSSCERTLSVPKAEEVTSGEEKREEKEEAGSREDEEQSDGTEQKPREEGEAASRKEEKDQSDSQLRTAEGEQEASLREAEEQREGREQTTREGGVEAREDQDQSQVNATSPDCSKSQGDESSPATDGGGGAAAVPQNFLSPSAEDGMAQPFTPTPTAAAEGDGNSHGVLQRSSASKLDAGEKTSADASLAQSSSPTAADEDDGNSHSVSRRFSASKPGAGEETSADAPLASLTGVCLEGFTRTATPPSTLLLALSPSSPSSPPLQGAADFSDSFAAATTTTTPPSSTLPLDGSAISPTLPLDLSPSSPPPVGATAEAAPEEIDLYRTLSSPQTQVVHFDAVPKPIDRSGSLDGPAGSRSPLDAGHHPARKDGEAGVEQEGENTVKTPGEATAADTELQLDLAGSGAISLLTVSDELLSPSKERLRFQTALMQSSSTSSGSGGGGGGGGGVATLPLHNPAGVTAPSTFKDYSTEPSSSDMARSLSSSSTLLSSPSSPLSPGGAGRGAGGLHGRASEGLEGRQKVLLYVQGHMDTLLVLLLKDLSYARRDTVNNLWKSSLAKLAELDFAVSDANGMNINDATNRKSAYLYLKYDTSSQEIQGTAKNAVTSLANELVSTTGLLHDTFAKMSTASDILCRTHTTCCYGHKTLSSETFFQVAAARGGGCPDPRDGAFALDQFADRKLYTDHTTALL